MKEHPILFSSVMVRALLAGRKSVTRRMSRQWLKVKAGDRLWVRETHAITSVSWPSTVFVARAERMPAGMTLAQTDGGLDLMTVEDPAMMAWCEAHIDDERWRPSIFMPRCLSRIQLEALEDARLVRLQDMDIEEARREGIPEYGHEFAPDMSEEDLDIFRNRTTLENFKALWRTLHTKPGERYEDNPELVRVGEFRRVL